MTKTNQEPPLMKKEEKRGNQPYPHRIIKLKGKMSDRDIRKAKSLLRLSHDVLYLAYLIKAEAYKKERLIKSAERSNKSLQKAKKELEKLKLKK